MSRPARHRQLVRALAVLAAAGLLAGAAPQPPPCPTGTTRREAHGEGWCADATGARQGPVWGRHRDGSLRYLGRAVDDLTDGRWRSWHGNGAPAIEAHYTRGQLTGGFRMWNAEGRLVYSGQHDARGEMDGRFERWWPDGTPRIRWQMRSGVHDGPVEAWYESGRPRMKGLRRNGREDGVWTWWSPDGAVERTCRYADGRPLDGPCAGPPAAGE